MIQMRDKNLNFIQFSQSVEKQLIQKLYHFSRVRRTSVVANPTFLRDYYLVLPKKYNEIRNLCVVVHFILKDAMYWKLRLDLEDKIEQFDLKKQLELKLLLKSRQSCLVYLYETNRYTSHEIFGNIVGSVQKDLDQVKLKKVSKKVVKPQRKRGYHDKGSLRPKEKWLENSDWSFTELQNEKERNLTVHLKSYQYLEKYLEKKYLQLIKTK